jgi:hypothetical protein
MLAVDNVNGKLVAVTIPAGDIVELVADPSSENEEMVDLLCEGRPVAMDAIDLKPRGIETQKI